MADAQQKALWPYGCLTDSGQPDENFRRLIKQDKERYLEAVLSQKINTLQLPLITASDIPEPEKPKENKRQKKNKNAFMKFLKKCLYFKPKTFLGTQLLITVLSTVIGIWISSLTPTPKLPERHHRPTRPVTWMTTTNKADKAQATQVLNTFYSMYQTTLDKIMEQQNGEKIQQTLICPGCKTSIQVESLATSNASVFCLGCQKPFQAETNQLNNAFVRQ